MKFEDHRTRLYDDISKIIFDARVQLLSNKSIFDFYQAIKSAGDIYKLREVEEFRIENNIREWIIIGYDDYAKYNCMIMNDLGYHIIGVTSGDFCQLTTGARLLTNEDVHAYINKEGVGIIINNRDIELLSEGIPQISNVLVMFSHIVGRNGDQYFDFFYPKSQEYFLDAGSLDGATAEKFVEWCDGEFGRIYSFEPNPRMIDICRHNLSKYGNKTEVYNIALWDKTETLLFNNESSKWDAKVADDGKVIVDGDSIDNILAGQRITFIKLDVEGAEMQVLKGAKKTILSNKPRMAISVYHNENDLFEIMDFLVSLNHDYKYALRHYHSDLIETILYVF